MRCEDCPTRACLETRVCTYRQVKDSVSSRLETCRSQYTSTSTSKVFTSYNGDTTSPPTQRQIDCVGRWSWEHPCDKRRPLEFTKHAYYEFIRNVISREERWDVRYEPDEDDIMEFCDNDVWCEYY